VSDTDLAHWASSLFIGTIIMCLTSHWPIISRIRFSLLILTISVGETLTISVCETLTISVCETLTISVDETLTISVGETLTISVGETNEKCPN
jgi:hypothetical protein